MTENVRAHVDCAASVATACHHYGTSSLLLISWREPEMLFLQPKFSYHSLLPVLRRGLYASINS